MVELQKFITRSNKKLREELREGTIAQNIKGIADTSANIRSSISSFTVGPMLRYNSEGRRSTSSLESDEEEKHLSERPDYCSSRESGDAETVTVGNLRHELQRIINETL